MTEESLNCECFYLVLFEKSHEVDDIFCQLLGIHGGGHHLPDDAAVIDDNDTIHASLLLRVEKIKGCCQGSIIVTPERSGEGASEVGTQPRLVVLDRVGGAEDEVGAVGGEQRLDGGEGLDEVGGGEVSLVEDNDNVAPLVLRDLESFLRPILNTLHLHNWSSS